MITDRPPFASYLLGAILFVLIVLTRMAFAGDESAPEDAARYLSPLGVTIVGGIACLVVAWLLSLARARWGWLRRGLAGNLAATVYGALTSFGAVVAIGAGVDAGLAAVGGSLVAGLGLAADTERVVRARAETEVEP